MNAAKAYLGNYVDKFVSFLKVRKGYLTIGGLDLKKVQKAGLTLVISEENNEQMTISNGKYRISVLGNLHLLLFFKLFHH